MCVCACVFACVYVHGEVEKREQEEREHFDFFLTNE